MLVGTLDIDVFTVNKKPIVNVKFESANTEGCFVFIKQPIFEVIQLGNSDVHIRCLGGRRPPERAVLDRDRLIGRKRLSRGQMKRFTGERANLLPNPSIFVFVNFGEDLDRLVVLSVLIIDRDREVNSGGLC